jgi:hypothetical protein
MTIEYHTGLVLVDPYNDSLSKGRKVWPRVENVAGAVDTNHYLVEPGRGRAPAQRDGGVQLGADARRA